jgi:lipid-A-disaccharide synthase-like uncharacterized protein
MFASRWLVQLHFARRVGAPVVPPAFWLMSLTGSLLLVTYFAAGPARDPIGVLGNLLPLATASYNLYLAHRRRGAGTPPAIPGTTGS